MLEPLPAVTVVVELAIVGPYLSPTLYFVTQRPVPFVPLYFAGIYIALYLSHSACAAADVSEPLQLPPPPPAPEPISSLITMFFIPFVIVSS